MRIGPFGPLQVSALQIYVVEQDIAYADDEEHVPFPGVVDLARGYIEIEPADLDAAIRRIGDDWDAVLEQPNVDVDDRRYGKALESIRDRLIAARRAL